jgi:oligopeptide/dipeptide ABC transporter ATP-binding protein
MNDALLQVRGLKKHFPLPGGLLGRPQAWVHAVDGIDFDVPAGKTVSLVGETGCGKSTTGRLVLRLMDATAGEIYFDGRNLRSLDTASLRRLRREMQIIFQDPFSSLNPRLTVAGTVGEPLLLHEHLSAAQREERIVELLEKVGLRGDDRSRYPHEFSGGQRQRIGIARALALKPRLIVADEPVSSLDVSIQAQIVNLLMDLQEEFGIAYLFISHDLGLVEHISSTVIVMYLGRIVEKAPSADLYGSPRHPYTEALLSSIPAADPSSRKKTRAVLGGDVPSPITPPPGCPFHPRCPVRVDACERTFPVRREVSPGHVVYCHVRG